MKKYLQKPAKKDYAAYDAAYSAAFKNHAAHGGGLKGRAAAALLKAADKYLPK